VWSRLSSDEKKLFNVIARAYMAALMPDFRYRQTTATLDVHGFEFREAFLNVELFQALYDQNKGHPLPPLPAIERQIEGLGVSPKQKERARQTFNKSAIFAGFIDAASGRFIKPGVAGVKDERSDQRDDDRNKNRNGGGDVGG